MGKKKLQKWGKSTCKKQISSTFKSGKDILERRTELFQNLVFCKNAEKQLKNEIDSCNISQISRKLFELQAYFSNIGGIFEKDKLNKCTPESPETLKRFPEDHSFELPNNEKRIFSWHIRFTGKYEGRIFFEPDAPNKRCYIGHIGGKLSTVKYKT